MKLTLAGKTYESDLMPLLQVTIGEARAIKHGTRSATFPGLTIADWREGVMALDREDPDVLAALVFLLRSRAGETVDWSELNTVAESVLAEGFDFTLTEGDLRTLDDIKEKHAAADVDTSAVDAASVPTVPEATATPDPASSSNSKEDSDAR